MVNGGSHLGAVRNWIQWHYCFGNGETALWGSHEELRGKPIHVDELEELSQTIRDAVLHEYNVKPKEHRYAFVVICDEGAPFSQDVDTSREAWAALFRATGRVDIYRRADCGGLGEKISGGTADEVRTWLLLTDLEKAGN